MPPDPEDKPSGQADPIVTPPEDSEPTGTEPAEGNDDGSDPKWKSLSRKHETEAAKERRRNAALEKRLAELEKANMSETEKAVANAKTEGEKAAAAKFANRLALAEFKAAAAIKGIDFDEIEDLINVSGFVDESGEIDSDAIKKRVGQLAKRFGSAPNGGDGKTSGGAPRSGPDTVNGGGGGQRLSRDDVEKLAATQPEKVAELYAKGELKHLV